MQRICIYTKDIQIITGKSDRYCRSIMKIIRKINNKEKHQPVSVFELSNYLGIDVQEVMKIVK
jgi:tRNA U34 5-carboxymethylaminomethyl modifying enzyme MnmG/GidA